VNKNSLPNSPATPANFKASPGSMLHFIFVSNIFEVIVERSNRTKSLIFYSKHLQKKEFKMRYLLIIMFIISLPFFCFAQETIEHTITHDGLEREYVLYVPESYTGQDSVPLLFNFHGMGGTAYEQMEWGDFRSIADSAAFLIAHPQGTGNNGMTFWNIGQDTTAVDDIGFTEAMIDSISAEYNINLDRVYATGKSMGGFFSIHLAGQLSEKIAAIASVSGTMTQDMYNNMSPVHPTPFLQIHGTDDLLVPYNGNPIYLSVADVLDYWIEYNNCNTTPVVTPLPDIDPGDGSTVEHWVYDEGDNEVNVEHFKVLGGGHSWPGSDDPYPGTNFDIDASEEIWNFFSRYDINGLIGGSTGIEEISESIPSNFALAQNYPNPFNPSTTISFEIAETSKGLKTFEIYLRIYDVTGKLVKTLIDDELKSGYHSVIWDGKDERGNSVESGIYIYKLQADNYTETRRMTLLR
jgi:polyhydroxybutyrate depolymerase